MSDKTTHFERNNFYFGKLMTARDFTDEQSYVNEKRWLINRLGLGWGVLCGLKVRPHPQDQRKVIVEPGFALDPYGHEILVCEEEMIDLTSAEGECPPEEAHFYYVSICYEECGINPSPVPFDDCEGYKELCVYNRIREGYRLKVSREKPDLSGVLEAASEHDLKCEADCYRFLKDPSPIISNCCPERLECGCVPLARICYNPENATTAMDIDISSAYRKLAFSNEILYELLWCLQKEVRQGRAAGSDRRQHVPLLASTIKGLKFQDGKNARLDKSKGFAGKYPFRLTSDGDYIWITERDDQQLWRINRKTNKPIKDHQLYLTDNSWGIAFDGRYMWITHHDAGKEYGKLTRVNVCTLEKQTISSLPKCGTLPSCYRFPDSEGAPDHDKLRAYPGEIVLHDGDIYIAHERAVYGQGGQGGHSDGEYEQQQPQNYEQPKPDYGQHKPPYGEAARYELSLTRIDPVKGCIVEVIDIPESDNRVPWSRIRAMASDGESLWITYRASSQAQSRGRVVVRRIRKENGKSVVGKPHKLSGEVPEHMVFDGTRLWVSHNDGVSVVDVESGREDDTINSRARHAALAYGGGELLWAALPSGNEAFINWVNIFSEEFEQWLELLESEDAFEISDMQFDGTYIYVAYHYGKSGQDKEGVIHRLLP